MPIDLTEYNANVKGWGNRLRSIAQSKGAAMGITHRSNSPSKTPSLPKLKDKYRVRDGAVDRVSITFSRTLIYTITGSGKGIGGFKGSRWINAKGETKKTNPASRGKLGTGSRVQKDFINQSLDGPHGVEELADIAAQGLGDAIVSKIFTS